MKLNCVVCDEEMEFVYYDIKYNHTMRCDVCEEYSRAESYHAQLLARLMEDYDERQEA